jgi:hypothetical protein
MNTNEHEVQISERSQSRFWRIGQRMGLILQTHQPRTAESAGRNRLLTIAALAIMALITVVPAHAQDQMVVAHIPFSFRVDSATLPAGSYTLVHQDDSQPFWVVESNLSDTGVFALISIEGTNEAAESAKLLFHRYGNRYFLSQIDSLGETYEMPVSKAERTMGREMARNDSKPHSLYVLASLR